MPPVITTIWSEELYYSVRAEGSLLRISFEEDVENDMMRIFIICTLTLRV
jgi:hypothetical protein